MFSVCLTLTVFRNIRSDKSSLKVGVSSESDCHNGCAENAMCLAFDVQHPSTVNEAELRCYYYYAMVTTLEEIVASRVAASGFVQHVIRRTGVCAGK